MRPPLRQLRLTGAVGRSVAVLTSLLIPLGCAPDEPSAPAVPRLDVRSPQEAEGEFIGDLYDDGVESTSGVYVDLTPWDPPTQARLMGPFSPDMWGNPNLPWMWEWYDPRGGGNCGGLTDYYAGNTAARNFEKHWSGPNTPPPLPADSVPEAHCIRPGT
jgi:hypothetical protein